VIGYLLRRLIQSLAVLSLVSVLAYGLIGLMPGDPVDLMIGADPRLTSEDAARLRALYGLDRPLLERYGLWLGNALAGDLGYSRLFGQPVLATLGPALVNTLVLMTTALALSLAIALALSLLAVRRPGGPVDAGLSLAAFAGISMPPFWVALLLIILFAVVLGVLPAGGQGEGDLVSRAIHLILPVASLTLASMGGHLRYVRAALLDALSQDHIRTARAKGLSERQVVLGHALRGALVPLTTIVGLEFGTLFSGALVTETVFAYPGMGRLIYDAILGSDYNLALAALLAATGVTLAGNAAADLALVLLDRRVGFGQIQP
jgi:peptide/nickel transport system permease protein